MRLGTFTRLFLAIYFVEAGLLLIVGPWTTWWDQNFFADSLPWLNRAMDGDAARFVVASAGIATAVAGLSDLRSVVRHRLGRRPHEVADAAQKP